MPRTATSTQFDVRLKETLKKSGYSLTEPRRIVFDALVNGPISHARLADSVNERMDRATVYRTLDLYERLGIVNRIWHGFKSHVELSEIFLPHHHHAVCQRCGRAADIVSSQLEQLLAHIAKEHGFLAVEHSVEMSGYCSDCHKQ